MGYKIDSRVPFLHSEELFKGMAMGKGMGM